MSSFTDVARRKLVRILVVVGAMWLMYAVGCVYPPLLGYGLRPRTAVGLIGIITMPFLHAHIGHLVANTLPIIVLLGLLNVSRIPGWRIVVGIIVLTGILLWLCGRNVVHIGASGLISGLITFLVLRGWFHRRMLAVIIAVITFLLYGSTLLWGVLPTDSTVSWDGHLAGAVAGGLIAYATTLFSRPPRGASQIRHSSAP
jgi:membrane associated rhomboid family serine protease